MARTKTSTEETPVETTAIDALTTDGAPPAVEPAEAAPAEARAAQKTLRPIPPGALRIGLAQARAHHNPRR